jgi:glycosyltransferase involved in cell wall biosynthesis
MPPCIWYVSKYVITPRPGDPAGRAYGLMRELARRGYRSVIVTSDSMGKYESPIAERAYDVREIEGMTLCRVRTLKYGDSNSPRRILSWLDFERKLFMLRRRLLPQPEVVVISSLSLLSVFSGLWLRRRYQCRLIFEVRDIWPLTIVEEGGYSPRNPLVRALAAVERLGYRTADAIIGTMPNLGEHVKKVTGEDLATHCVPMGVDELTINGSEPIPPTFAETYIPRGKFVVAYAGSIGISNALDVFFETIQSMQADTKVHFVVLGDGELRESYVSRFGHLKNLTFVPKIPKAQVHDFLTRCDLLYLSVHKSEVWEYGLSLNKLIDYMLAAKPIVASYSGFPSMIDESKCGVFVPASDAFALKTELLRFSAMDPKDLLAMGVRGRAWLLANRQYPALADEFLKVLLP